MDVKPEMKAEAQGPDGSAARSPSTVFVEEDDPDEELDDEEEDEEEKEQITAEQQRALDIEASFDHEVGLSVTVLEPVAFVWRLTFVFWIFLV